MTRRRVAARRAIVALTISVMISSMVPIALTAQSTKKVRELGFQTELTLGGEIPYWQNDRVFSACVAARIPTGDVGAFRLSALYVDQLSTYTNAATSSNSTPSSLEQKDAEQSFVLLGTFDVPVQLGEFSIAPSVGLGVAPFGRQSGTYQTGIPPYSQSSYSNSTFAALFSLGIAIRYRHLVIEKLLFNKIGGSNSRIGGSFSPYLFGVRF